MVPNTSDDLPEPETPVNTVSLRLGISRLTSFRLFTRAPWTRIRSWRSAACGLDVAMREPGPPSAGGQRARDPAARETPERGHQRVEVGPSVVQGQRRPDRGLEAEAAQDGLRAVVPRAHG